MDRLEKFKSYVKSVAEEIPTLSLPEVLGGLSKGIYLLTRAEEMVVEDLPEVTELETAVSTRLKELDFSDELFEKYERDVSEIVRIKDYIEARKMKYPLLKYFEESEAKEIARVRNFHSRPINEEEGTDDEMETEEELEKMALTASKSPAVAGINTPFSVIDHLCAEVEKKEIVGETVVSLKKSIEKMMAMSTLDQSPELASASIPVNMNMSALVTPSEVTAGNSMAFPGGILSTLAQSSELASASIAVNMDMSALVTPFKVTAGNSMAFPGGILFTLPSGNKIKIPKGARIIWDGQATMDLS